jgi:vacuolar-type H+-ATPase subunit I/STV1
MFPGSPNLSAPVKLGNVTLTIPPEQCAPLLASARELIGVKLDAIERAERAVGEGRARPSDLERHRAELAQVESLADELDTFGSGTRDRELTARRALVDEVIVSALAAEAQELADSVLALTEASDVGEMMARVRVVDSLLSTLAKVRS